VEESEDFEFYPTTNEIIGRLVRQLRGAGDNYGEFRPKFNSLLDIGAGHGKVLTALKEQAGISELYAIEKSLTLCAALPPDIFIVGTDFAEQSLLSKAVDVVFCNPPYSQFEQWAEKIIRQSASRMVYLVLPARWQNSRHIADALAFRCTTATSLGDFDFEDAEDRTARAKVQLLEINLEAEHEGRYYQRDADDAFERFFKEQFADLISRFDEPKADDDAPKPKAAFSALVVGPNYPAAMVEIYQRELAHVEKNYALVAQLDIALLKEFAISPPSIMKALKERLSGLRSLYWHELFSHLGSITDKLCSQSRKTMLETLQKHLQVDFTLENILAVVVWACKNANRYIDSQLLDVYEAMVEKCNVILYKSNQRTWRDDQWRYNAKDSPNTHFALDFRIVAHRLGGLRNDSYSSWNNGLSETSCDFLRDLQTIARNLGFECDTTDRRLLDGRKDWTSGEKQEFHFTRDGRRQLLFDVRAFLNGNIHLRLHKRFILALNVEHGRLRGWLRTKSEAVAELQDAQAAAYFNYNLQLPISDPALMLTQGDK
jgi:hypothetical protein